ARLSVESISPWRVWGSSGPAGTATLKAASEAATSSTVWKTSELPTDRGSVSGDRPSRTLAFGMSTTPDAAQRIGRHPHHTAAQPRAARPTRSGHGPPETAKADLTGRPMWTPGDGSFLGE